MYESSYLSRIENFLPVILDEQPLKHFDKYSVNYTFVAEFGTTPFPLEENFTFFLNIAENAIANVYLNDTLILSAPLQSVLENIKMMEVLAVSKNTIIRDLCQAKSLFISE